jgi:hypothetical protein
MTPHPSTKDNPMTPRDETVEVTQADLIERLGKAMREAWDEICSDTGCHPLDIYRVTGKLFFRPNHWVRLTALHLASAPQPLGEVERLLGGYANLNEFTDVLLVLAGEAARNNAATWEEEITRAARIIAALKDTSRHED